jgi:hypothetical protein
MRPPETRGYGTYWSHRHGANRAQQRPLRGFFRLPGQRLRASASACQDRHIIRIRMIIVWQNEPKCSRRWLSTRLGRRRRRLLQTWFERRPTAKNRAAA